MAEAGEFAGLIAVSQWENGGNRGSHGSIVIHHNY
jgi:hypothetical protein